jgi:glycosyltransferase involved in cell wall biosynthesis
VRILLITRNYPSAGRYTYGAERMCGIIAEYLVRAGHQVAVLTAREVVPQAGGGLQVWPWLDTSRPNADLRPEQWTWRHHLRFLRKPRGNYRATRRALRRFRPDLVYAYDLGQVTSAPLRAVEQSGCPAIFHAEDYALAEVVREAEGATPGGLRGALLNWFFCPPRDLARLRRMPLIACSRFVADWFRAAGWEEGWVWAIPNAAGEEFLQAGPREFPASPSVLLAARCVPDKGIHVAVEAIGRLAKRGVPAELHIVGAFYDPVYQRQVEELVASWGIADRIIYRGYVAPEAMPAEYARHRCAAMPSTWQEPFGMVSVEAQAAGTPVIVSGIGGLPETIRDGETGLVTPPGDAEALAQALETILTDPDRWRRMSDAGRQWAAEHFSPERTAGEVEQRLREAVSAAGG